MAKPRAESWRQPGRQAALLFAAIGIVVVANGALPGGSQNRPVLEALGLTAVLTGVVAWSLPWHRWAPSRTLPLAFIAIALVGGAGRYSPPITPDYGIYFVVVFVWLGMFHPPRTALLLAAPAAAAYLTPFIGSSHNPPDYLRSVGTVIPVCVVVAEVMAATVQKMRSANEAQERSAAELALAIVTDELTGVGNRRHGTRLLESLEGGDALLLLDLDKFKQVNDTFGHAAGDRLLAQLGAYLHGAVRHCDLIARYGGDEFIIILRQADGPAVETAERLLHGWRLQNPLTPFSVGVAVHDGLHDPAATFGEADAALYEAKRAGRDQVRAIESVTAAEPRLALRVVGEQT